MEGPDGTRQTHSFVSCSTEASDLRRHPLPIPQVDSLPEN